MCREGSKLAGRGDLYGELGVIGATVDGGYAELCLVPASHVFHVPEHISLEDAATFPTCHLTASHGLFDVGRLAAGETVLVHAAGSGVSIAAIQLAARAGATVLATAGTPAKLERAAALGAAHVLNNRTGNVVEWAREVTDGRGVDMVFDHVGTALFESSLFALATHGRLVTCGNTSGDVATIPSLGFVFHHAITILGSGPYEPHEFGPAWERFCTGHFDAVVDSIEPLAEVARRAGADAAQRGHRQDPGSAMTSFGRDAPYPEPKATHTMARTGRPFTDRKPPPAAPIWDVIEGFGRFHVLVSAIELGVFDALEAAGAVSVDELAVRVGASPRHLHALLQALAGMALPRTSR